MLYNTMSLVINFNEDISVTCIAIVFHHATTKVRHRLYCGCHIRQTKRGLVFPSRHVMSKPNQSASSCHMCASRLPGNLISVKQCHTANLETTISSDNVCTESKLKWTITTFHSASCKQYTAM